MSRSNSCRIPAKRVLDSPSTFSTRCPRLQEIERIFLEEAWPGLEGQPPAGLVHRITRPRGGNARRMSLPFEEAINQACWDLAAKQAGLPLYRLLGGTHGTRAHLRQRPRFPSHRQRIRRSSSAKPLRSGYRGFKIKVGHPDVEWDLNRLELLRDAVGGAGPVMVDANEAWSPREAVRRLDIYRRAGFDILWVEDPCIRDDFDGLREIRAGAPWVHVNSGEYLDLRGKRRLIEARGVDILNVHGNISDVMRAGWLAAEHGIRGEPRQHDARARRASRRALPEADWLEYSFQNYNHLVEQPIEMRDGYAHRA